MIDATLTTPERLQVLEQKISEVEALARAEKSFAAAFPEQENQWDGNTQRLERLRAEREDILLQLNGQRLNAALDKEAELKARLDDLTMQRQLADRRVADLNGHPVIQRYRAAFAICRDEGWGHSWILWSNFLQKDLSLRQGAPDCAAFFSRDAVAKDKGLVFTLEDTVVDGETVPADRKIIHEWVTATDSSNRVLAEWNSVASELRNLKHRFPELNAAI